MLRPFKCTICKLVTYIQSIAGNIDTTIKFKCRNFLPLLVPNPFYNYILPLTAPAYAEAWFPTSRRNYFVFSTMQNVFSKGWPIFFTATIQNWKSLLEADQYKEIIVTSLNQLVAAKKVKVNAFVLMHNHVHLIWQCLGENKIRDIEISFKKFTAKRFREQLLKEGKLKNYIVNKPDRKHHFWKRNSLLLQFFNKN